MVEYLRQFWVDEQQLTSYRAEVVRQLEERRKRDLEGLARFNARLSVYTLTPEEYGEWCLRCMEEREALDASLRRKATDTLARLDAEAEALRAKKRAVPFWPYDPDEEVIGDGQRVDGAGAQHDVAGVPGLPATPERGA